MSLRRWLIKKLAGAPPEGKTQAEWEEWRKAGYFVLMGSEYPFELWAAADENYMCYPESIQGADGLPHVQAWIAKQEHPERFKIVLLEARWVG